MINIKKILVYAAILVLLSAISLVVTEFLVWGICACFGLNFSLMIGLGVWLILWLVNGITYKQKSHK